MFKDEALQYILRNAGTTSKQIRDTLGMTSPSLDKRLTRLVKHGVVTRKAKPTESGQMAYRYYPTEVGMEYKNEDMIIYQQ